MNYKKEKTNDQFKGDTNLNYKEHSEFFDTFYRIRTTFQTSFAESHYKKDSIKVCFQNIQALIMLTTGQIIKVVNLEDIKTKEIHIKDLIRKNNNDKALDKLRDLHDELSLYWAAVEILPKVDEEQINPNIQFWKEETNAGFREMKKAFYDSFMLPTD